MNLLGFIILAFFLIIVVLSLASGHFVKNHNKRKQHDPAELEKVSLEKKLLLYALFFHNAGLQDSYLGASMKVWNTGNYNLKGTDIVLGSEDLCKAVALLSLCYYRGYMSREFKGYNPRVMESDISDANLSLSPEDKLRLEGFVWALYYSGLQKVYNKTEKELLEYQGKSSKNK